MVVSMNQGISLITMNPAHNGETRAKEINLIKVETSIPYSQLLHQLAN